MKNRTTLRTFTLLKAVLLMRLFFDIAGRVFARLGFCILALKKPLA
jgi:hypothetical protein